MIRNKWESSIKIRLLFSEKKIWVETRASYSNNITCSTKINSRPIMNFLYILNPGITMNNVIHSYEITCESEQTIANSGYLGYECGAIRPSGAVCVRCPRCNN